MRRPAVATIVMIGLAGVISGWSRPACAQDAGPAAASAALLKAGEPAPDFSLTGADGKTYRLADLRGQRPLVLVVFRGLWCIFCRMQLGDLQDHLAEFHNLGAEVWAISSTDPVDKLATYAQVRGFTFPLLADDALAVTKRYGVLNVAQPLVAYPATFVIDRRGVVRYARVDVDFTKRPPVTDLLAVVRGLAK
jgi:peroxiredoxin